MPGSRPGWPRIGMRTAVAGTVTIPRGCPGTIMEARTPMSDPRFNKYRAAVDVLQRGRDVLVDELADEILTQADDLIEGGFLFNEFLEGQGTRIHFLGLLLTQLEQSAEALDESRAAAAPPAPPKKRRTRSKKLERQAAPEGSTGDS